MKVRVIEEYAGELQERGEDAVTVIRKLAGETPLEKAESHPAHQIKQSPAQFEYDVMVGSVKQARKRVNAIKAEMDKRIAQVLKG